MDAYERRHRTVRLLETRLEVLALVSERALASSGSLDVEVTRTAAATRNAIALGILSPDEAGEIWAGVARRHPRAEWCRHGFHLAA